MSPKFALIALALSCHDPDVKNINAQIKVRNLDSVRKLTEGPLVTHW